MMVFLPNVHHAYLLLVQEKTQRQVFVEPIDNFSIIIVVQGHSKPPKDMICEHSHHLEHLVDECKTFKYNCKCDQKIT